MNLNDVEYYYIRNAQGDIIGLFDGIGIQVVSYIYDSWGKLLSIDGTLKDTVGVKNPYRYRGYRYDTETGLYYLQSRYYNSEWGRFINADGIIGQTGELLGHNLFVYCKNNPVNMKDENGFRPIFSASLSEETDGMRAASFATMSEVNMRRYQASQSVVTKVLNTAVAAVGSKAGQAISSFADSKIGDAIVNAAEINAINAWRDKPLGTLTLSRMLPKESSLLQGGKNFVKKGGGLLAVAALGLNAGDDFHNHGLVNGGKRFAVDMLSTVVGVGIGVVTAVIPGGVVWETGISMAVNDAIFDPWKNSID